mgnify:CR=1 FL=1
MLLPFLMIVVVLKQQGHRMKEIMEYLKQSSVSDQIYPVHQDNLKYCAQENEMCECEIGSIVHYGVATEQGIDSTKYQALTVAS